MPIKDLMENDKLEDYFEREEKLGQECKSIMLEILVCLKNIQILMQDNNTLLETNIEETEDSEQHKFL